RRRHTRSKRDWSSDVCSSDLVETHPVEDGAVRPQAEQSGLWVTGLWMGGDRTDLHKAETERGQALRALRVLVETRCQAQRAGKRSEERRVGKEGEWRQGSGEV